MATRPGSLEGPGNTYLYEVRMNPLAGLPGRRFRQLKI